MAVKEELKSLLKIIVEKTGIGTKVVFFNSEGIPIVGFPDIPFEDEVSKIAGGLLSEAVSYIYNFLNLGKFGKCDEITVRTADYTIIIYKIKQGFVTLFIPQKVANIGLARLVVLPMLPKIDQITKK